jgi:hypothetical protein
MTSLFKLIPIATLAYGGVANQNMIKSQMGKILNITQSTAVQVEVNDISKMIYLDTIDGTAPKDQNQFVDYVRRNMRTKTGQSRDTSKDFWGTEYRYEHPSGRIRVVSAGPDKQFGTDDDISSGYQL